MLDFVNIKPAFEIYKEST